MATNMACPFQDCTYSTGEQTEPVAIAYFNAHMLSHTHPPPAQQSVVRRSGPKLDRPVIESGASMEEWNLFTRRWTIFKEGSHIDNADASRHLFQCADGPLGDALLKMDPDIVNKSIDEVLQAMKKLAVIPIATGILRSELLDMKQLRDEAFRKFASRVRGKAETCEYTIDVTCGPCNRTSNVNFTDHIMRDVLLAGIYDADIRREMYGIDNILQKSVNEVIALVEKKEMARDAHSAASTSAISSMKQQKKKEQNGATQNQSQSQKKASEGDKSKQAPCPHCKKMYSLYREGRFGWNSKPFDMCRDCFRTHRRRRPADDKSVSSVSESDHADVGIIVAQVSGIGTTTSDSESNKLFIPPVTQKKDRDRRNRAVNSAATNRQGIRMDHHVFSEGEWHRSKFLDHPTRPVSMSVRRKDYTDFSRPCPLVPSYIKVVAKLDTCAQSCLWSKKEFLKAGFKERDLIPVSLGLNAANKSSIKIDGAILVRLNVKVDGQDNSCATMVYISPSCEGFFMSLEAMLDLDLLQTFNSSASTDGSCNVLTEEHNKHVASSPHPSMSSDEPCACQTRTSPPQRPDSLPFPAVPENNPQMEVWLRDRFASSTFNICPRQKLPEMTGPPVEIHLKDGAIPYKAQTAVSVPLNWQKTIKEQYSRDESLGVLERPPPDDNIDWCFREVYSAKSNGEPRRTVDYRPLNRWVKRDAYATESPFHVVRRIPGHSWKTVTDAFNGYHLVPLHPESKKYTNFISMEGTFQYNRCPQGGSFAGDAYNRRHASITAEVLRKETVVDDTCLHDVHDDLEQHWWRIIDYLILCGQNGIILNPDKLQFARKTVDFAGFRVSDSSIEPLPKYLDAIRDFPIPRSITDIRSWFGLVNQLSNYAQLREMMRPFREFLSPKIPFTWNEELQKCFEASKIAIIDAIKHGVSIYDPKRTTCLRTDWSNLGIGYYLSQKHCDCESENPGCCEDGWQVTLAGSRFLMGPEQRYVAIEGEALAIAWALEQTRYFTLGCEKLTIATDHKPLVAIFGDKDLNQISNPRIFRLKQRTLQWFFQMVYLPGKTNSAADAVSRHPSPSGVQTVDVSVLSAGAEALSQNPSPNGELSDGDCAEIALVGGHERKASICNPILWSEIVSETSSDPTLCLLASTIKQGFPIKFCDLNSELAPYWNIRNSLDIESDVIWYNSRIVLPLSLRSRALEVLHSAHQGVTGMEDRARCVVYWPGITDDIKRLRSSCAICCKNAPSQASLPAATPEVPSTPFEAIFADFFLEGGHHFLVAGDRLSGWVEVYSSRVGSSSAGSSGVIAHLRSLFTTFGVPLSLTSDEGLEFTATATSDFLSRWGVHHRKSSAYNPQSNGRAEVAVKKVKRLLKSCIGPAGTLNNDKFMRGMLQLRNTPDPECKLSPAQILFGHQLRDAFTFLNRSPKFENPAIQPIWREAWAAKENALRTRFARSVEKLNSHARQLPQLEPGERVFIQNQHGPHPNKWDRSGVVLESLGHDQYSVKVDGTGRVTIRNRRFLRHYTLHAPTSTPGRAPINTSEDYPVSTEAYFPRMPVSSTEGAPVSTTGSALASVPSNVLEPPLVHPSESAPQDMMHPSVHPQVYPPLHPSVHPPEDAPASTHVRRGPGRPRKRVNFNFSPHAAKVADPPQVATTPSEELVQPSTPSRPRRTRCQTKKYDASTGEWS